MDIKKLSFFVNYYKYFEAYLDERAYTAPYILKSATGLSPEEINTVFYGIGASTGQELYSFTMPPREITLTFALSPRPGEPETVASLRQYLYRLVSPTRNGLVQLRFDDENDSVLYSIFGVVKSIVSDVTSDRPTAQLTLVCDQPFFRGPEVVVNTSGLSKTAPEIVDLVSTAPHGFKMHVKFTGSTSSFILNSGTDTPFRINYNFASNDILYISSTPDNRYLHVFDSSLGNYVQLASTLSAGSVWPLLYPGINSFTINTNLFNWEEVSYSPTYWGI